MLIGDAAGKAAQIRKLRTMSLWEHRAVREAQDEDNRSAQGFDSLTAKALG